MKEQKLWWGKYYSRYDSDEEPRLIWLGPITEQEMREDFPEFRHHCRNDAPVVANREK